MESNATGESCPKQGGGSVVVRLLRLSLAVTLVLAALGLVQQFYGIIRVRHDIENDRIQKTEDYYRWRLPEQYRTPPVDRQAIFLENGRPGLNRSLSNRNLREFGAGWYFMVGGGVNFIPHGGADPRVMDGAHFSLVTPLQFKPKVWRRVAVAVFGQLLLLQWLRRRARPGLDAEQSAVFSRWKIATLVVLGIAAAVTWHSLSARRDFTDHAFVIKGIQESDAGGWYDMAAGLAAGHGFTGAFENQRPFYSVYLAGLFQVFGEGLRVLRGFNALALVLAVGGVFTLGRLLGSVRLAAALALMMLASDTHLNYLQAALTENGGLMLAVLALLAAWQAAWTLSPHWAAVAGLVNGLAALVSGVTLFTLPGYALVIFLFPLFRRTPWRRALLLGAVYTAAASVVVGSWLVRQKAVHDRFTLSYNTSDVLAGGADPEEGYFNGRILDKARAAGLDLSTADARYDSLMRMYRENVAADPAGYLRRVALAAVASVKFLPGDDPAVQISFLLALFAFGLIPAWRSGQWHALAVAAVLMAAWARHEFAVTPLLLLAGVYLMLRRERSPAARLAVLLLVVTVAAVMFLAGLAGNVATKRFWLVADWSALALVLGGARHFIEIAGGLLQFGLARLKIPAWLAGSPAPLPRASAAFDTPRFIPATSVFILALSLFCGGVALAQTLRGPQSRFGPLEPVSQDALAAALAAAAARQPALAEVPADRVVTRLVLRNGRRNAWFGPGEGTQHWLPAYAMRPYARWVTQYRTLNQHGEPAGVQIALERDPSSGVPPRDAPLMLAGILTPGQNRINSDPVPIFETLFILPLRQEKRSGEPWRPALDQLIVFPPSPEALAAARAGR